MKHTVGAVMRAIRVNQFGGPEVLKLEDNVPVPQCGKDDFGDRVFCSCSSLSAAYAEMAVFAQNCVFPLSSRLPSSQGAALGIPYFTAYRALIHKGGAKPASNSSSNSRSKWSQVCLTVKVIGCRGPVEIDPRLRMMTEASIVAVMFMLGKITVSHEMKQAVGAVMRAIRVNQFGGPEVLRLEANVPVPVCGDNDVLVRVMSVGVNPVETYIRQGTHVIKPSLPYTPGMDCAGVVCEIGPSVTKFKVGDRVFCSRASLSGAYAEMALFAQDCVFPLSSRLSFSQGAALGIPYFTAFRALIHKGCAKPGCTLLIHGASGAVGIAATQIAKSIGLRVFGTAGTPEGLKLVKDNGADAVFCHKEPDYLTKLTAATNGEGADLILEMFSNVNLAQDLTCLNVGGRVVVIGCRGTVEINPRLLMQKETSIVGVMLGRTTEQEWSEMAAFIEAGMESGWVKPVIHKEYPLEKAQDAHFDIINSFGALGKLVLSVS